MQALVSNWRSWRRTRSLADARARFDSVGVLFDAQDTTRWPADLKAEVQALLERGRAAPLSPQDLAKLEAALVRVSSDASLQKWADQLLTEYRALIEEAAPTPAGEAQARCSLTGEPLRAHVATLAAQVGRLRTLRRALGWMRTIVRDRNGDDGAVLRDQRVEARAV